MVDKEKTLVANEESDLGNDNLDRKLEMEELEVVAGAGKSKPD